jgi:hypothetical protein
MFTSELFPKNRCSDVSLVVDNTATGLLLTYWVYICILILYYRNVNINARISTYRYIRCEFTIFLVVFLVPVPVHIEICMRDPIKTKRIKKTSSSGLKKGFDAYTHTNLYAY